MFRLGQILHLPEALTFYYAHVGYYITQGLVSASMPILARTLEGSVKDDAPNTERRAFLCLRFCQTVSYSAQVFAWMVGASWCEGGPKKKQLDQRKSCSRAEVVLAGDCCCLSLYPVISFLDVTRS